MSHTCINFDSHLEILYSFRLAKLNVKHTALLLLLGGLTLVYAAGNGACYMNLDGFENGTE